MFKLIKNLIGLAVIAALIFLALSLWQGGKPFRWFGTQSREAGEIVKQKSEKLGEEADKLKKKTDDMRDTTKKVSEGVKKTKDTIHDIAGSKTDR
jgi:methyl-accepting chemotaxis protein